MMLTIGLSYAPESNEKYNFYRDAIRAAAGRLEEDVTLIDLSAHPNRLGECDGVLFTGGADIDPARYGKQAEEQLCKDIDDARDQAEFDLASNVEEKRIPTLGICRGLQLLNVHRGGTLVTDIETFGGRSHSKLDGYDQRHRVKVEPGSYLSGILRTREGEINSAHHQAAERPGDGLLVTARAEEDGTIEALEWADPTGKPFFLAVQWHPERMDFSERFAGQVFESFLWEVAAHKALRARTA
ncbi:MAG: gamma-glutamyl-gamma-aminobutyrate hydrolase family protein [Bacteroidota bacterium]|nr:gamma-glutamyl-gamma-aminobutyrate hydrolase family protein [Bacteroidota bacterium]MDP4231763.1 gamma-glutamyl-gamma-aminobutyrate hydrolase family protein [Bacteroidota bacterium]MDP4243499.1 gamma-glutamyl-gamma-aminobutyrate hydrolase family protein [Bacteroidota bacterium]MDP4287100.1 gamma-glutamyl-gamma-aminobutyrate hydrolase family protein [Bacteroidota bacterium]